MKNFGPSQIGLLLLVAMVCTRAFFASDAPVAEANDPGVESLATTISNVNFDQNQVESHQLAVVEINRTADIDEFRAANQPLIAENDADESTEEENLVDTDQIDEDDVAVVEEEEITEEDIVASSDSGSSTEFNGSLPIELTLFTPDFEDLDEEDSYDEDEEIADEEVAPLDSDNTITSQVFQLFPISLQH